MKNGTEKLTTGSSLPKNIIISSVYPLGGNYGGILQAYALQRVIRGMGNNHVVTINSSQKFERVRLPARILRFRLKQILGINPNQKPLSGMQKREFQRLPQKFVTENIDTLDFFGLSRRTRRQVLAKTSAIVVGSDQVWRGGMANVLDQMLQYAHGLPITKVSYAASFGADKPIRFTPRVARKSRMLAQSFSAISVREESGIRVCEELWGVDALHHVDPTLLLSRADYEALIEKEPNCARASSGRILAYVLDRDDKVEELIDHISAQLGLSISEFYMDGPSSAKGLEKHLSGQIMRPVEEWISNFAEAEFVVTDSFHGTVFAIIFNKPFVSIGNRARGLTRFESLLKLLGLESRLFDLDDTVANVDLTSIQWSAVNDRIKDERERSIDFLRRTL